MFFVFRASINALKEGEDAKRKTYRALCVISKEFSIDWVKEKLEAITDLELAQHTPIRVLHRRADAKRLRSVYYMKVESPPMTSLPEGTVNESNPEHQMFILTLATQAGTYVKEFVHGDFGRTEPNVAQILGCDVDIIALDVEVKMLVYKFCDLSENLESKFVVLNSSTNEEKNSALSVSNMGQIKKIKGLYYAKN